MRILWIQQYFGTSSGWGSQRQYRFARQWVAAGHKVEVVCSPAYDASLEDAQGLVDGIRIHLSRVAYRPQMGFVRRCWAFLQFMLDALWFVTRQGGRYDVLVASSGPLTNLIPALWGRLVHRLPYVFEVLDVWPDAAEAAGILRNRLFIRLCRRLEALGYRWASRIVTCSTGMTARVHAKLCGVRVNDLSESEPYRACLRSGGSPDVRLATIAHGADLGQPDRMMCRQRLLKEQGWPDDICIVLYMGAMGCSNAIEDVVEAMRGTAGEPGIAWVFAGSGSHEGLVQDQLQSSRGRFMGKVAHSRMRELCAAADVNVVSFRHEPLFFENSPNKFFDGIAAGLPTVFNRSTWLEPWLTKYDCGIVCTGSTPGQEMAEAIRGLAKDSERRRRMGQKARLLAEEVFDRDKLGVKYLETLEEALK